MTNPIFHSPEFEFKGIRIPEFDMESGKLIRLCLPNFDFKGTDLVRKFRRELLAHFETTIPEIKWSKEYSETGFRKLLKSLTVEDYILKKLDADKKKAQIIAEYLELDINEKVKKLILGKRKALAIKLDFEKYDALLFDYYGVSANEFDYLERIVESEMKKGKYAIAIDRLEFNQREETNKNIKRVKIIMGNSIYKT